MTTSPLDGLCERNRDRQAMIAARPRTLALPMPEQAELPTVKRFSSALIEFTLQGVAVAVAEWMKA
jgi:hypothetical protein